MAAEESLEELIKYYADVESQGESILVNKQQVYCVLLFRVSLNVFDSLNGLVFAYVLFCS